jgi:hypothetical protein
MDTIFTTDEQDSGMLEKFLRVGALYLLSGAAAFSLEVVVYADKGWLLGVKWWLQSFLPVTLWLMAPYIGLSSILLKMKHTLRQLLVLFFGSAGVAAFAVVALFDGFFIHIDPRNKVLFWVVPLYQWLAVAGTAALRHAVGRSPSTPTDKERR